MYLLVYVDDIIVISSSESATARLVTELGADFAVKDLGKLHYFLGLEVTHFVDGFRVARTRGTTRRTQRFERRGLNVGDLRSQRNMVTEASRR
jgi:hypothetical protein